MTDKLDEAEILNLADVSRWGVVSTSRRENVAEHSFQVALLFALWYRVATGNIPKGESLIMCLLHDEDEAIYGDAPSPVDTGLPSVKSELSQAAEGRFSDWWFDAWLLDLCDKVCTFAYAIKYANGYNRGRVLAHMIDRLAHIREIGRRQWAMNEYNRPVIRRKALEPALIDGIVWNSLMMLLGDEFPYHQQHGYVQIFNPFQEKKDEQRAVRSSGSEGVSAPDHGDDRQEGDRVCGKVDGGGCPEELRPNVGHDHATAAGRAISSIQ